MVETLLSLSEVLERLKGRVGRTNLRDQIKAYPRYGGGPTYRRNGRKLLFTEADYERLVQSFEASVISNASTVMADTHTAALSGDKAYKRALELLTRPKALPNRKRRNLLND